MKYSFLLSEIVIEEFIESLSSIYIQSSYNGTNVFIQHLHSATCLKINQETIVKSSTFIHVYLSVNNLFMSIWNMHTGI